MRRHVHRVCVGSTPMGSGQGAGLENRGSGRALALGEGGELISDKDGGNVRRALTGSANANVTCSTPSPASHLADWGRALSRHLVAELLDFCHAAEGEERKKAWRDPMSAGGELPGGRRKCLEEMRRWDS